jgi:hypothetical protein
MLGDGGQEIGRAENLEIAVYFDAHPRAVDDIVRGGFHRHFLDREGIAQMEIEVFSEGVNGHDDARDALGQVQGHPQILGEAFAGEGA